MVKIFFQTKQTIICMIMEKWSEYLIQIIYIVLAQVR